MTFRKWHIRLSAQCVLPVILVIAGLFVWPETAIAQQETNQEETATEEQKPKIRFLPPAYNDQMLRLAELLGSLHYLRELCGANEGQLWRDQMQELIQKEEANETQRAQMIAGFNRGFRGLRETYGECTPTAIEISNSYLAEGARISAEIPLRYGR